MSGGPIKVLHVYRTYFPDTQGGLEETIRQICRHTPEREIEHRVFTLSKHCEPERLKYEQTLLVRAKEHFEVASCSISFSAMKPFREQAKWADIVHYHFPWPFMDLLHLLFARSIPSVVTYHSDIVRQRWLHKIYAPLQNAFLRDVDRIVCTSPNYLASSPVLRQYKEKVESIPIGLGDISHHISAADSDKNLSGFVRREFFLFVGVLRYYKGLSYLLHAMRDAEYGLVIVGQGPDEISLKNLAVQLGLTNVLFTGFVDDQVKTSLMHRCLGVILPSHLRSEAFGVTLVEGARQGKPLISAELCTGTTYVNIDGVTGVAVMPKAVDELRSGMDRIQADKELAREFGRSARERYETHFSGDVMGSRYAKVYRLVISGTSNLKGSV